MAIRLKHASNKRDVDSRCHADVRIIGADKQSMTSELDIRGIGAVAHIIECVRPMGYDAEAST